MKHVRESLREFYDYKFFSLFEEEEAGTDKETLKSKEQDALKIVDKITKDFEDFKKDSGGEILRYKEFWEENQQSKKQFTEPGDVYKLFGSDYVVGVLELPVKTLADGSIEGGLGATDEPEEEIIEGKEVGQKTEFFEEQAVPTTPAPVTEAEEGDDLDLDLNFDDEAPTENPEEEQPEGMDNLDLHFDDNTGSPAEVPGEEAPQEEVPAEEPMPAEKPTRDLTAPQQYLVVYDLTGGEREEIFRCGSNNAVKAFTAFYNDIFKGAMKSAIADYKKQKEEEKLEAEKAEKAKKQTEKQNKVKKFLGENLKEKKTLNETDEDYDDDDLSDYEWAVSSALAAQLQDNNIEYDEDNFSNIMYDKIPFLLQCMKNGMSFLDCAVELMDDKKFMKQITNEELDESVNEGYDEEDKGREEFARQMAEDHDYRPDEDDEMIDDEDDLDEWLDEVADYLQTDFEVESEDVETFMDISMAELEDLFNSGKSAFDASGIVAANEDAWEELKQLKEEDDDELEDEEDF